MRGNGGLTISAVGCIAAVDDDTTRNIPYSYGYCGQGALAHTITRPPVDAKTQVVTVTEPPLSAQSERHVLMTAPYCKDPNYLKTIRMMGMCTTNAMSIDPGIVVNWDSFEHREVTNVLQLVGHTVAAITVAFTYKRQGVIKELFETINSTLGVSIIPILSLAHGKFSSDINSEVVRLVAANRYEGTILAIQNHICSGDCSRCDWYTANTAPNINRDTIELATAYIKVVFCIENRPPSFRSQPIINLCKIIDLDSIICTSVEYGVKMPMKTLFTEMVETAMRRCIELVGDAVSVAAQHISVDSKKWKLILYELIPRHLVSIMLSAIDGPSNIPMGLAEIPEMCSFYFTQLLKENGRVKGALINPISVQHDMQIVFDELFFLNIAIPWFVLRGCPFHNTISSCITQLKKETSRFLVSIPGYPASGFEEFSVSKVILDAICSFNSTTLQRIDVGMRLNQHDRIVSVPEDWAIRDISLVHMFNLAFAMNEKCTAVEILTTMGALGLSQNECFMDCSIVDMGIILGSNNIRDLVYVFMKNITERSTSLIGYTLEQKAQIVKNIKLKLLNYTHIDPRDSLLYELDRCVMSLQEDLVEGVFTYPVNAPAIKSSFSFSDWRCSFPPDIWPLLSEMQERIPQKMAKSMVDSLMRSIILKDRLPLIPVRHFRYRKCYTSPKLVSERIIARMSVMMVKEVVEGQGLSKFRTLDMTGFFGDLARYVN